MTKKNEFRKVRWRGGYCILILTLLLSACFGGAPPADNYYRLTVPLPAPVGNVVLPGVVEVERFGAAGLTGDRALLFSYPSEPDQVRRYTYHLWTDSPPVLLQDQLARTLRAAHVGDVVVSADLRVPPDYIIEGRLRRFEQIAGSPSAVVVEADMGVVRLHGSELLMLKTYRVEMPAKSEQVADVVAAFQAALADLFTQFVADLTRLPAAARLPAVPRPLSVQ